MHVRLPGYGWAALTLALSWLLCGCSSSGSSPNSSNSTTSTVLPDNSVQGRVVSVNAALRYVVMDFSLRGLPALNQRLNIYRDGQKLGVVKVTGPIMGTAAAGDIVTGQAAPGDSVRED